MSVFAVHQWSLKCLYFNWQRKTPETSLSATWWGHFLWKKIGGFPAPRLPPPPVQGPGSVMRMVCSTKSPTCCGKHSAHLSLLVLLAVVLPSQYKSCLLFEKFDTKMGSPLKGMIYPIKSNKYPLYKVYIRGGLLRVQPKHGPMGFPRELGWLTQSD